MKGLVLTYLLAYGGAIVALFNPFVGVCVYWLFDIVRPQYMFAWAGADGSYSQVIALATIVGWAAKGFGDWSFKRSRIIIAFFVASTLWTVLSAVDASNQEVATAYLEPLFKRAIMFTIAVTTVTTAARLRTAAWVIVGGAGYVSLEMNLAYLGGFNHARQLGYGGMDNNSFAISLVTCLGVALIMALYSPRLWQKAAALGSAAAIAHTVLLTFSRGGMLGMIVAGSAAFVILPKRPKYLAALGGTLIVSLTFAGPEVRERFASSFSEDSERDWSAQSRVDLWRDCLTIMQTYPLLGVGPGHFPLVAEEFGWNAGKEAHSLWMQVGAETGVPGLVFLLGVYVSAMLPMLRLARSPDGDTWVKYGAFMVFASLAGFITSAQFVTIAGLETPLYVVVIAAGLLRLHSSEKHVHEMAAMPRSVQTSAATVPAFATSAGTIRARTSAPRRSDMVR
jgi:O-antigen ligase